MSAAVVGRTRQVVLSAGAVLGALCLLAAVLALVLDLRVLVFRSGSMSPTIGTGALAVARTVPGSAVGVGDVVSVPGTDGTRVTHRVVAVEHDRGSAVLELRGDANRVSDPAPYRVREADRVLFSVPLLGYAAAAIASPVGLAVLALYAVWLLSVLLRRPRSLPGGPARHRGSAAPAVAGSVAVALVVTGSVATGALSGRAASTQATWTDGVGTTGSMITTPEIVAPELSCRVLGAFRVRFDWTAVPGATSYTFQFGLTGSSSRTTTDTTTSLTGAIGTGTATVVAHFGTGSWTSEASNSRSYTLVGVTLCS